MKAKPILILACALLIQSCANTPDPNTARQKELAGILKPLQKPGVLTEDYQEAPGWYEPTNRQALRNFIAKHPETEEAYQAEVWLVFASAQTERQPIPSEEKRRKAEMAGRLNLISHMASRSGTQKTANLQRAAVLFEEDNKDHAEFKRQADEISSHIEEYESEKDKQFLRYLELTEIRRSEIEPTLRYMVVVEECYEHHLDKALALAKELKGKFPTWETQSVNSEIEMIELYKRGWSPNSFRRLAEN